MNAQAEEKESDQQSDFTGRVQCELLTTLPLKFRDFQDNNQKPEMTTQWRNYSINLWKFCDVVGPTIEDKISS